MDRGSHSLETICLLIALKIKFPDKITLLRGNHEDRWINSNFGFLEECQTRLKENPEFPGSVFNTINLMFDFMPLVGIIDDQIMCIHGGIGSSYERLD